MKLNVFLLQVYIVASGAISYLPVSASSVHAETQFTGADPPLYFFYRRSDRPEVYLKSPGSLCHVQNPSQLSVLQGLPRTIRRIYVVQNDSFRSGLQFTGACSWPDGLYRLSNNPEVYHLYGNQRSACWVRTPAGVDARGGWDNVRVVDSSRQSLLTRRQYRDKC